VAIGFGQIVSPLCITYLLDEYAFTGAMLIESVILLNICAAALLFRPVPTKSNIRSDALCTEVGQTVLKCLRGFKCVKTLVFALGDAGLLVGELNFFMTIPFAMTFWEYEVKDSAYVLMCAGVSSLFSRIGCSLLADMSWFNVRTVYIVASFGAGGCCIGKKRNLELKFDI